MKTFRSFNVRADVRTPPEPGLRLEQTTAESSKQPPRTVSRPNFIELCHQVTQQDEQVFKEVAQVEVYRPQAGAFHDIEFGVEGTDARFTIATTRPELLAACVGVTAHPEDERYKGLFGKRAITPLFRVPVPIFPSELADPTKGTGS